jgi:hypothetical protein
MTETLDQANYLLSLKHPPQTILNTWTIGLESQVSPQLAKCVFGLLANAQTDTWAVPFVTHTRSSPPVGSHMLFKPGFGERAVYLFCLTASLSTHRSLRPVPCESYTRLGILADYRRKRNRSWSDRIHHR